MMCQAKDEIDRLFEIFADIMKRDVFLSRDVAMQAAIAVYSKGKETSLVMETGAAVSKSPAKTKIRKIPNMLSITKPVTSPSPPPPSPEINRPHEWNIDFTKKPKMYSKFDKSFEYNPRECDYCHGEDCFGGECVNYDIDDGFF